MASLPNTVARFDGSPEPYKLVHDRKRDVDHRSKYALGAIVRGDGDRPNQRALKPVKAVAKYRNVLCRPSHSKKVRCAIQEKAFLTAEPAEEPFPNFEGFIAPDAEIAYSFDSTHGPSEGGDVLSAAINKAVERFETKEMEKLVKNEYCILEGKDYEVESGYFGDDDFEWV